MRFCFIYSFNKYLQCPINIFGILGSDLGIRETFMNKRQRSLSSRMFSYVIENVGNDLEGWDGEGGGRDVQVGGDIGKLTSDSC